MNGKIWFNTSILPSSYWVWATLAIVNRNGHQAIWHRELRSYNWLSNCGYHYTIWVRDDGIQTDFTYWINCERETYLLAFILNNEKKLALSLLTLWGFFNFHASVSHSNLIINCTLQNVVETSNTGWESFTRRGEVLSIVVFLHEKM